jgi:hypothetical protein
MTCLFLKLQWKSILILSLLVHLAAILLGIVSSAVILYFGFKAHPANQPLGLGQLSISLGLFVSFSLVSQLIVHWPFLYRTGQIFALIFIPMPYLYTVFYTQGNGSGVGTICYMRFLY